MNTAIIHLSTLADPVLAAIERASIIGLITFGVAWLICRTMPKLPASIKCWIWRLAFLKLLLSLATNFVIPLPVLRAIPLAPMQFSDQLVSAAPEIAAEHLLTTIQARSVAPHAAAPLVTIENLITLVWCSGAIISIGWMASRWIVAVRQRRRYCPVDDQSAIGIYLQVAARLVIRRPPPLLRSSEVQSPMLLGAVRPVIVIPESMVDSRAASLRMIFAHELSHFARHDTRWTIVSVIARIIFWFHPLVIWAQREMDAWREIACDDAAVAAAESTIPQYARMLLEIVAVNSQPIPLLAVGVVRSHSTLHRRLVAMQYVNSWSSRQRAVVTAAVAVIGVGGVIPWKLTAQQTPVAATTLPQEKLPETLDMAPKTLINLSKPERPFVAVIMTDSVKVRATADGLAKVLCKPGDHVQRGQVVVKLDTGVADAELDKSQKTLQKDELELARKRSLFESRSISTGEMDDVIFQINIDKSDLEAKKQHVEAGVVRAPLTGVVNDVMIHEHEYVAKGDLLMNVVSASDPVASSDVPAGMLPKMRVGQNVVFQTAIYPDPFAGQIDFISPTADGRSQTIQIHCVIKDTDGKLRPGLAGRLFIKDAD